MLIGLRQVRRGGEGGSAAVVQRGTAVARRVGLAVSGPFCRLRGSRGSVGALSSPLRGSLRDSQRGVRIGLPGRAQARGVTGWA